MCEKLTTKLIQVALKLQVEILQSASVLLQYYLVTTRIDEIHDNG